MRSGRSAKRLRPPAGAPSREPYTVTHPLGLICYPSSRSHNAPPEPVFSVNTRGDGRFEVGSIGFPTLINTQTVSTGLVRLYYRDELAAGGEETLDQAVGDAATTLVLQAPGEAEPGDLLQIEHEIVLVTGVQNGGLEYEVERGRGGSAPVAHASGTAIEKLETRIETVAFRPGMIGAPEGSRWARSIALPNARLALAELEVTNRMGDSPTAVANFSELVDRGLRSLRGGQLEFQLEGVLGVLNDAVPALIVDTDLSIRDALAVVKIAPVGADLALEVRQDGALITTMAIPDGQTTAAAVNGVDLPALREGSRLTLNILGVGSQYPGSDLSVAIRV